MDIKRAYIYWAFAFVMAGISVALLVMLTLSMDMEVQVRGLSLIIGTGAMITAGYSAALIYAGWKVRKSDD